eukprot:CAMPEP_0206003616 /NCGR_PEP_ID=MMETSP1464-20131121/3482_1 /ASSEMBLY_ACC=CAM_ASM_001124 /TAXON_ID=119497 /ORGANISM="Exanthemachrysis gayraliae, Strain RCC1523" /LENGTH=48 /DNA_ID= /DNA_START= /DNA_END= /DNA_ORIENTATION=
MAEKATVTADRLKELEGYWSMSSEQVTAFGGNPVFELSSDGRVKIPSR